MIIICFHVLQFPIHEVLVNATHIACRCTNIGNNVDNFWCVHLPLICKWTIIHAQKSPRHVSAEILLAIHNVEDVSI